MAKNSLVTSLDSLIPTMNSSVHKIVVLFGDQPDVLEAIREARKRKCSYAQIAKTLSTPVMPVSESAVKSWLQTQGID